MKPRIAKPIISGCLRAKSNPQSQDQDGMALVLALFLGLVLLTGISGLLARQLMSRRLSARESYQQMAEAAANNGLNQIL